MTTTARTINASDLSDLLTKEGFEGLQSAGYNNGVLRGYPEGVRAHTEDMLRVVDVPVRISRTAFDTIRTVGPIRLAACIVAHESREVYGLRIVKGPVYDIDYLQQSNKLYDLLTREHVPFTDERDNDLFTRLLDYQAYLLDVAIKLKKQIS